MEASCDKFWAHKNTRLFVQVAFIQWMQVIRCWLSTTLNEKLLNEYFTESVRAPKSAILPNSSPCTRKISSITWVRSEIAGEQKVKAVIFIRLHPGPNCEGCCCSSYCMYQSYHHNHEMLHRDHHLLCSMDDGMQNNLCHLHLQLKEWMLPAAKQAKTINMTLGCKYWTCWIAAEV